MLILISGPYRSGTGDDPEKMVANQRALEDASWPIFKAGHIPMIGEWVAQPVWRSAGGQTPGDDLYEEIFYPAAERLISICDAVLRLPGESRGADNDVRQAVARGIPVYRSLAEIPPAQKSCLYACCPSSRSAERQQGPARLPFALMQKSERSAGFPATG